MNEVENKVNYIDYEGLNNNREQTKLEIIEKLKVCDKFCVVRPTSWGKSYLMKELCFLLEGNKVIFEPEKGLSKFIGSNLPDNTKVYLYTSLLNKSEDSMKKFYGNLDYIFLDEAHTVAAPRRYEQIKLLLSVNPKAKVIGFTATPKRTDGINIINYFFDGNTISELYLKEALDKNYLPSIKYVRTLYNIRDSKVKVSIEDYYKFTNKQKKEYLEKLEIAFKDSESLNNIENILNKNIDFWYLEDNLKILIFLSSVRQIDDVRKHINEWFSGFKKNINVYSISYKETDKYNEKQLDGFKNNKNKNDIDIMLSVNKFNLGYHIDNVKIAILMRYTDSDIVFLQQLGRTMSSEKPLIIDLVSNIDRLGCNEGNNYILFRKLYNRLSKSNKRIKCLLNDNNNIEFEDYIESSRFMKLIGNICESGTTTRRNYLKNVEFVRSNHEKLYFEEIAYELNVSCEYVSDLVRELGIRTSKTKGHLRCRLPWIERLNLLNLVRNNEDKTNSWFANVTGYKMSIINEFRKRYSKVTSISEHYYNLCESRKDDIVKLANLGKSRSKISKEIDIPVLNLKKFMKDKNIVPSKPPTIKETIIQDKELMTKIKDLYYVYRMSQDDIAKKLNLPCHPVREILADLNKKMRVLVDKLDI